ncbi:RNase adapter RapZ [Sphingomonas sp. RHCKR47]|uniref:RNase adapter RapZ n=1 Tax=Sphingomonas citricola TaxID=2862498 RepID=UPI001CA5569C|nr:RNase adapter RapZ [Sphingomonas citricola]MBW6523731.1 RNase adapter RapZ [Sphingomonas citricola]
MQVLLVVGMSGAGKSTVLRTLEDIGWETVDNLPITLLMRFLHGTQREAGASNRPLALGFGARTRDFDPDAFITQVAALRERADLDIGLLFLDCSSDELARRYAETRRRHPMAEDRPVRDGIIAERGLLAPLRRWANRLIDTTDLKANALAHQVRTLFGRHVEAGTTLTIESFGFSRGVPPEADLMFDMRFLRNPHWEPALRPRTGRDPAVAAYIADDPAYEEAVSRIEDLLLLLLPRYRAEGKPYVTVAFGCTGGKHRSVHVTERVAARLRNAGFSPTVLHRDLAAAPQDTLEGRPQGQ